MGNICMTEIKMIHLQQLVQFSSSFDKIFHFFTLGLTEIRASQWVFDLVVILVEISFNIIH